jgi:predicted TIM-barrel fold metal-dependent hydrolase
VGGRNRWVIDGDVPLPFGDSAACAIQPDGSKWYGLDFISRQLPDVHRGSSELGARLALMDDLGIWAQIVYPNVLGFGGQNVEKFDSVLRLLCTRIYNDAMADMQGKSGGRIFPMPLLPWWNVRLAVAEVERIHGMGMRGVNINSDPQDHADEEGHLLADLGDPYWHPLWEACTALNLPVNFHIGASKRTLDWYGEHFWQSQRAEAKMVVGSAMQFFGNSRVISNFILSGVFDRYPSLKIVSVESGVGWVPFLLESLDYQYSENCRLAPHLCRRPSEYFKQNVYACFWFERRDLAHLLRRVGIDNVLFETDFPHPTCLYPDPMKSAAEAMADLTQQERRKVLSGNAAHLYSIPLT